MLKFSQGWLRRCFFILFSLLDITTVYTSRFLLDETTKEDRKKFEKYLAFSVASNKHIWRRFSLPLMTTFTSNWRQLWWQRKKCLKHATNSIWNQRRNISRFYLLLCMSVLQTSPHYDFRWEFFFLSFLQSLSNKHFQC